MYIVIGLGNPGQNLEKTRHNIGFRVLDILAKSNGLAGFNLSKKYNALVSEGFLGQEKIIALKPQTFMNVSGIAVKAAIKNFKLKPENLIVIHDDADLLIGSLKISKNHGPGGHKGVGSIIQELKTQDFARIRIGIAPAQPQDEKQEPNLKNFVLKNFTIEEEKMLAATLDKAAEAVKTIIESGTDEAMNRYN
jgi:PTH1 family peptidyl-tRNA hydrolase